MRFLVPPTLLVLFVACGSDDGLTIHDNDMEPEVVFLEPANDELFVEGESIVFRARVEDNETAREDLQLIWSSTRGGTLSVDTLFEDDAVSIVLSSLEPGEQTISLKAIDERAQEAVGAVTVVIEENLPPSLAILSPTDEGIYGTGLPIPVEIDASDDHFDAVDLELTWGGAATGAPDAPSAPDAQGEAGFDLSALPAASYTVTVTAADPYGQTQSASVSFEVVDGDVDGDGHLAISLGGDDCDDDDADIFPTQIETCNAVDDNCNGQIDEGLTVTAWYLDGDGDGFGRDSGFALDCAAPANHVDESGDCDDDDEYVNPDETEVCNGIDDDCQGGVDDGLTLYYWLVDSDDDGYGVLPIIADCAQPPGTVEQAGDCNDSDPSINEGADEICDNGIDEDCSGDADDGCFSDYTGTWDITPYVNTSCLWGQFHPTFSYTLTNSFGAMQITDNAPNVQVVTSSNVDGEGGALLGTFDTADHFVATSRWDNYGSADAGFDEDYTLDITFTSLTELSGSVDMVFEQTPAVGNCTDRSFNFTGVRQ